MEMSASNVISVIERTNASGGFGWNKNRSHVKAIIFSKGNYSIMAYAINNNSISDYITIYDSYNNGNIWNLLILNSLDWRLVIESVLSDIECTNTSIVKNALIEFYEMDKISSVLSI